MSLFHGLYRTAEPPDAASDPIAEAEARLASAIAKRDEITRRLHEQFDMHELRRTDAIARGDVDASADLVERAKSIEILEETLRAATNAVEASQRELDQARDKVVRQHSVAELGGIITKLETAGVALESALTDYHAALLPATSCSPYNARPLHERFSLWRSEIAVNFRNTLQDLRGVAAQIVSGQGPPDFPRVAPPEPPPAPKPKPSPPMMTIVPLRSLRWDFDGETKFASSGWDIQAPSEIAQRAIRLGFACEFGSQRAREARGRRAALLPDVDAIDITDEPLPEALQPKALTGIRPDPHGDLKPYGYGQKPWFVTVPRNA